MSILEVKVNFLDTEEWVLFFTFGLFVSLYWWGKNIDLLFLALLMINSLFILLILFLGCEFSTSFVLPIWYYLFLVLSWDWLVNLLQVKVFLLEHLLVCIFRWIWYEFDCIMEWLSSSYGFKIFLKCCVLGRGGFPQMRMRP